MINQEKIKEVRKALKKAIKEQKMFIENEPVFSGHPLNTITPEKNGEDKKNEHRNTKEKRC